MADLVETEVKFYLPDPDASRAKILSMGARSQGGVFERNICFENREKSFKSRDMLLRLRRDDKVRLTFKSPPPKQDDDFKIYNELEVEVNDFDTCLAILKNLEFFPEKTYEKWRETFLMGLTKLLIDTTPFGTFLEIEGDKGEIRDLAEKLGHDWGHRILLNYLEIFEIINTKEALGLTDMTFESFRSTRLDVSRYLPDLYTT